MTSTISSPPFTVEDRALLQALLMYESSLCACGIPRSVAWHSDMDGEFEADQYVCHACTARRGTEQKVIYAFARNTRSAAKPSLAPFVLGVTTSDS